MSMRLYSTNLCPYASRTRVQIYAKGLEVEVVEPPDGPGSDAYREVVVTGKIPALEVDGQILPESEVIAEYLEDRFPTPSLRPDDPMERARTRLLSRLADLYVSPVLMRLFAQLDPGTRDQNEVDAVLAELAIGLDRIETYLHKGPYAVGHSISTADCALVPLFFYLTRLLSTIGAGDPFDGRPQTESWWQAIQHNPHASRVLGELDRASKAQFAA